MEDLIPSQEPSADLSTKRLYDFEWTEVIEFSNLDVCHIKASRLSAVHLRSFFQSSCNLHLSVTSASLAVYCQFSPKYSVSLLTLRKVGFERDRHVKC